jgi:hypothetical protein
VNPVQRVMRAHSTVKNVGEAVAAITALVGSARAAHNWVQQRYTYTVALERDDRLYGEAHSWLLGQIGQESVRAITANSRWNEEANSGDVDGYKYALEYYSDDRSRQTVNLKGHRIHVMLDIPDMTDMKDIAKLPERRQERIVFTTRSVEGRQAVMDLLSELSDKKNGLRTVPELHVLSRWGGWTKRSDIPPRGMDSVILPAGQAERILADLKRFLGGREEYVRRSIPYHYGVLLEGSPGTGKSSLCQALATECGLDLWYLPLKDVDKDANLIQLIGEVTPNSILLLEDIDTFAATHDRSEHTESDKGASLGALLQSLDGVTTPFGLITFLTSNRAQTLDPALIRPGRIDAIEHIGYVTAEQSDRLFTHFYSRPPRAPIAIHSTMTPADILSVCKRHLDDPEAAENELC